MSSSAIFVTVVVVLLLVALIKEWLRPGLILFSGAVVFLCAGILSPSEVVAGFSNKGMITVALLFLVSEGVRRSRAPHTFAHEKEQRNGNHAFVGKACHYLRRGQDTGAKEYHGAGEQYQPRAQPLLDECHEQQHHDDGDKYGG